MQTQTIGIVTLILIIKYFDSIDAAVSFLNHINIYFTLHCLRYKCRFIESRPMFSFSFISRWRWNKSNSRWQCFAKIALKKLEFEMVRVHTLFVSLLWKWLNKYFDLIELIDGMHRGEFPENEKELKCFTLCVAESAGAVNIINFRLFNRFEISDSFNWFQLTKKKELSEVRARKQIETQLPINLRPLALGALETCKDIRKFLDESFQFSSHV